MHGRATPARRAAALVGVAGALALVIALAAACSDTPLPGRLAGTYKVVGQIVTNTCGLDAPNPWTFDVQISEDGTLLYWSYLDGTSPLSSPLSAQLTATLTASEQENVDGTADGSFGPCTMIRTDSIPITLATGWPPPSFSGTIVYAFSASPGADCSDQLVSSGGLYDVLPCGITYSMSASHVSTP
jgi:hypothetical protein